MATTNFLVDASGGAMGRPERSEPRLAAAAGGGKLFQNCFRNCFRKISGIAVHAPQDGAEIVQGFPA